MTTILVQARNFEPPPVGRKGHGARVERGKSSLVVSRPLPPANDVLSRADSQQLSQLFSQHGPRVYRRALRLLGNPADAEEATQEIFIRALRGAEGFQQQSQLTTWLYQIATHYCLNLIRDRARRAELYAENLAPTDEGLERTEPVRPDDLVLLRRLLADADERQASAAIYVFLDGMSHEEAAAVMGVSKRTVGNLIERFQTWAGARTALDAEPPAPPERKTSGFFGFRRRRS
jgi:RNA polymerase sigma-70 factor (ECF subfamily)